MLIALLLPASAGANTGHWTTYAVTEVHSTSLNCEPDLTALSAEDGNGTVLSQCPSGGELEFLFLLPPLQSKLDATLSIAGNTVSGNVPLQIRCYDSFSLAHLEIVSEAAFDPSSTRRDWDIPAACYSSTLVSVSLSAVDLTSVSLDLLKLNVKSSSRNAALLDVEATSGTCGPDCVHPMTLDDEVYSPWVACSPSYGYANPTDFVFDTFDHASMREAWLSLDANTSGPDARARISCVDASGNELAQIYPDSLFYPQLALYNIPTACFESPQTRIRINRSGANCLGIDHIRLHADSSARSHPITTMHASAGTCNALDPRQQAGPACAGALNVDDDHNLQWIACNSDYAYASPTDLQFHTPDWNHVSQASLTLDLEGSGSGASARISCLDEDGSELAEIQPTTTFAGYQTQHALPVPPACFASPNTLIRIEAPEADCLAPDFIRLQTVSTSGVADGMVVNTSALNGYASADSIAIGEPLELRVHAPNNAFSVEIVRYGLQEEILHSESNLPGGPQAYRADSYRSGAGYNPSWSYTIPSDYRSGLYGARLTDSDESFTIPFIVRDVDPTDAPAIAVLGSTNTWTAYNTWNGGGDSLRSAYHYRPSDESFRTSASQLSRQRPNPGAQPESLFAGGHLAAAERWALEWLEREDWAYSMVSAEDIEDPALLSHFQVLIINTHSEYWTPPMYEALELFLDAGGHLLYLGGNGLYWRTTSANERIEVQKGGGTHQIGGGRGGLWRNLGQAEHRLLGVGYTGAGFGTSAPYRVTESDHWLFDGSAVSTNQLIGSTGEDGQNGIGASGWETDKVDFALGTPVNAIKLAEGTNPDAGGAHLTYHERPSGAIVLAAGSINFTRSLVQDDVLSDVLNKALERMATTPIPVSEITAPDGTCLGLGCESDVHHEDGTHLRWAACSSSYDYGNPTDFHFDLGPQSVDRAWFRLVADASGSDARFNLSCVDGSGNPLATLESNRLFDSQTQNYSWPLEPSCFDATRVSIRIERLGVNCLGPDHAVLDVVYASPVPEPSFAMGISLATIALILLGRPRSTARSK